MREGCGELTLIRANDDESSNLLRDAVGLVRLAIAAVVWRTAAESDESSKGQDPTATYKMARRSKSSCSCGEGRCWAGGSRKARLPFSAKSLRRNRVSKGSRRDRATKERTNSDGVDDRPPCLIRRRVLANDAPRSIKVRRELLQSIHRGRLGDVAGEDEQAESAVGGHASGELVGRGGRDVDDLGREETLADFEEGGELWLRLDGTDSAVLGDDHRVGAEEGGGR
jgi:uncharacterized low-complexity protein